MKLLKYVALFLVVVAAAFLLVGVVAPTFTYESRVEVNAPLEKSWAVFNDVSLMGEWLIGFKSVETLSGQPGAVGSKYKMVFEEDGRLMEMTETITAFQPNEEFAFELDADPMIAKVDVRFSGDDQKTEIVALNHMDGKNLIWKSILRLSKSSMEKRGQLVYDNLKSLIERKIAEEQSEMSDKSIE